MDPQTVAARFDAANAPLTAVIDAAPATAWDRPSPCEDWAGRDVVGHLIETQRSFLTGRGIDLGPDPDATGDPARAWADHVGTVRPLLDDAAVAGQAYDGYFGPTTIGETIVRFYVLDMVVHRWDLARAVGADDRFTPEELDQIEADLESYGDAAYTQGVFAAGVEAPDGADRQARLLARMGRRA